MDCIALLPLAFDLLADATAADVYAAGKCVMCVAKTTMHDDSGVGARAGRQRAKPQTNRERNLR